MKRLGLEPTSALCVLYLIRDFQPKGQVLASVAEISDGGLEFILREEAGLAGSGRCCEGLSAPGDAPLCVPPRALRSRPPSRAAAGTLRATARRGNPGHPCPRNLPVVCPCQSGDGGTRVCLPEHPLPALGAGFSPENV